MFIISWSVVAILLNSKFPWKIPASLVSASNFVSPLTTFITALNWSTKLFIAFISLESSSWIDIVLLPTLFKLNVIPSIRSFTSLLLLVISTPSTLKTASLAASPTLWKSFENESESDEIEIWFFAPVSVDFTISLYGLSPPTFKIVAFTFPSVWEFILSTKSDSVSPSSIVIS